MILVLAIADPMVIRRVQTIAGEIEIRAQPIAR